MQSQQLSSNQKPSPLALAPAAAAPAAIERPAAIPAATTATGPAPAPTTAAAATQVFGHLTDGPAATSSWLPPAITAPTTTAPTTSDQIQGPPKPTIADYNSTLDKGLDALIASNRTSRTELDKEKAAKAPTSDATAKALDGSRQQLLDSLNLRSGVYDEQIHDLQAKLGKTLPKNPTPEQKAEIAQLAELTKEKNKYSDQQTALQRWHDRGEINSIDAQLKAPNLDPAAKTQLLARKKELATGLLSTVKTYDQFADPWGSTRYGHGAGKKDTLKAAGCGPTGLADLMDFRDQEDPEGHHSQGDKDYYNPRRMADYATDHGRIVGSGTNGTTMMKDLAGSYAGFEGNTVHDLAGAREQLEDGVPVLFLGHGVSGKGDKGQKTRAYDGHFMVLSGVDDSGQNFRVNDGGRADHQGQAFSKIHTMTAADLGGKKVSADNFWTVNH